MSSGSLIRGLAGALGVVLVGYGVFLLVSRQDSEQIFDALVWLAGGVLLHDGVLVPLTLLAGWLSVRVLAPSWRSAATVAVIIVGPLTLLAVPVLGRFGARADNATLLDRPYLATWWAIFGVTVIAVLAAGLIDRAVVSRRGVEEGGNGTSSGR